MGKLWFLILALFTIFTANAQADTSLQRDTLQRVATVLNDTTIKKDSLQARADSLALIPKPSILLDSHIYSRQPFIDFTNPSMQLVSPRQWQGKEAYFYATVLLLMLFAVIRNGFGRYSSDLVSLFFRTTVKQRQIKEQLMQAPLPSLLLNILFFLSGGLFINLVIHYFNLGEAYNFWLLLLYCIAGLALIYTVKFITLKLTGWLFRISEATDTYTFVVFSTNKIMGIALLPFIILLSFSTGTVQQVAFTLSLLVIGGLLIYRYFLSYVSIHRQVKINFFHFLLYLAAFEIIPLLLINKVLFKLLGENP